MLHKYVLIVILIKRHRRHNYHIYNIIVVLSTHMTLSLSMLIYFIISTGVLR